MIKTFNKILNSRLFFGFIVAITILSSIWYLEPKLSSEDNAQNSLSFKYLLDSILFQANNSPNFFIRNKLTNKISIQFPKMQILSKNNLEKLERKVYKILAKYDTGLSTFEEKCLANLIVTESIKYNLDPLFVLAVIKTESTFYHKAVSTKNAIGLMQIIPFVGEMLANELNIEWKGEETLYNPIANIKLGTYFLSKLAKRFNYNQKVVLSAYNYGPTSIDNQIKEGTYLETEYAFVVLSTYKKFSSMNI